MKSYPSPSIAALLLALIMASASNGEAQEIPRRMGEVTDRWSEPNPGVRYLRRTTAEPVVSIHALLVDTSQEGVSVLATPYGERWGTVTDFAEGHRAAAAINGGFWGLLQRPEGIAAGGGELWDTAEPNPDFGYFGVDDRGRAVVRGPDEGVDEGSLARIVDAVSGRPVLVTGGEPATEVLDDFLSANHRQPRTAIGVSRDGRTVILVVSDGRQSHSRGLTLYQLARLMQELGAYRAINLDGGGSSAMFVREAGGLVSSPARGRWVRALGIEEDNTRTRSHRGSRQAYVRGVEREVMNQIAILAPSPPDMVVQTARGDDYLGDSPRFVEASFLPLRSEPIRLGRVRELLIPLGWVVVPLVLLWIALSLVRRLYRGARVVSRRRQLDSSKPLSAFGGSS